MNLTRKVRVRYWLLLAEGAGPAAIWLFYLTSPEHEATFAYVVNTLLLFLFLLLAAVILGRPRYPRDTIGLLSGRLTNNRHPPESQVRESSSLWTVTGLCRGAATDHLIRVWQQFLNFNRNNIFVSLKRMYECNTFICVFPVIIAAFSNLFLSRNPLL